MYISISLGLRVITCPFGSIKYRSLVHECGYFMGECLCMDSYVVTTGEESILSG